MALDFDTLEHMAEWQYVVRYLERFEQQLIDQIVDNGGTGNVPIVMQCAAKLELVRQFKDTPRQMKLMEEAINAANKKGK